MNFPLIAIALTLMEKKRMIKARTASIYGQNENYNKKQNQRDIIIDYTTKVWVVLYTNAVRCPQLTQNVQNT